MSADFHKGFESCPLHNEPLSVKKVIGNRLIKFNFHVNSPPFLGFAIELAVQFFYG